MHDVCKEIVQTSYERNADQDKQPIGAGSVWQEHMRVEREMLEGLGTATSRAIECPFSSLRLPTPELRHD